MSSAQVLHVCSSDLKGTPKRAVSSGHMRSDYGLVGDAHAGPGHRQVSLLHIDDIRFMEAKGLDLEPGAFGENLVVGGFDLLSLGIGSTLQVGEAELEITQIGKVCHSRCAIYDRTGDCIMPRQGVFARVLQGGDVRPGSPILVHRRLPRETASDLQILATQES